MKNRLIAIEKLFFSIQQRMPNFIHIIVIINRLDEKRLIDTQQHDGVYIQFRGKAQFSNTVENSQHIYYNNKIIKYIKDKHIKDGF